MTATVLSLVRVFASLSLMAIGGANVVVPEIHRAVVEVHHWVSDAEFAQLYAIAQAAPGPNVLFATLLGWRIAGMAGALAATLAMCLPAVLVTVLVAKAWRRLERAPWRASAQRAFVPVTIGLTLASGYLLVGSAGGERTDIAVALSVAGLAFRTRVNPLVLLGGGALVGIVAGT